jgi:cytochrome c biogenesis protein CcdA
MLHTRTLARQRNLRFALCALGGAVLLIVWMALEVQRLRNGVSLSAANAPVTATFLFICHTVGPSLPTVSAALIPSALAVMAPCLLQMSIVLVTALTGVAASQPGSPRLWRQGLAFGAGFLGLYGVAALLIAWLGVALVAYAPWLKAAGGVMMLALGLAVLRLLPRQMASGCRGPRWLIMTGKATLRRPFSAGVAFAVYCVGCCGPYLSGLALLGAGSGSATQGALLVLGFAAAMGTLLLLPIFGMSFSQQLNQRLMRHATPVSVAAGTLLIGVGTLLALEPLVVLALVRA